MALRQAGVLVISTSEPSSNSCVTANSSRGEQLPNVIEKRITLDLPPYPITLPSLQNNQRPPSSRG